MWLRNAERLAQGHRANRHWAEEGSNSMSVRPPRSCITTAHYGLFLVPPQVLDATFPLTLNREHTESENQK